MYVDNGLIDVHVHITSPEIIKNAGKIGEREHYFDMLSKSPVNKFATAEEIVEEMGASGVSKSVVFGFSFSDMGLCKEANDYTIEAIKKYGDKLIGYMCISPAKKGLEAEIDRCISSGLRGIGEIFPDGQQLEIDNINSTKEFAGLAVERALPIMIHANEPVGHYYCGKTETTPVKIAKFCENHPEVKVIFAHWGGGLLFYELMPEMKKVLKNAYYDIAASPFLYSKNIYKTAKEAGVLDKILFGSDYPLIKPKRYLKEISESGLNDEDIKKIIMENAVMFGV